MLRNAVLAALGGLSLSATATAPPQAAINIDETKGVSVANKFASEGVQMAVGHFNSGVSLPASEAYLDAGILQITPGSIYDKLGLKDGQRVKFIEKYRSYVINYNLGQDLVREWVEREAGPDAKTRVGPRPPGLGPWVSNGVTSRITVRPWLRIRASSRSFCRSSTACRASWSTAVRERITPCPPRCWP